MRPEDLIPIRSDKPDRYSRTKDGVLVYPGMPVYVYGGVFQISSVYENGTVSLVSDRGKEGMAPLDQCVAFSGAYSEQDLKNQAAYAAQQSWAQFMQSVGVDPNIQEDFKRGLAGDKQQ